MTVSANMHTSAPLRLSAGSQRNFHSRFSRVSSVAKRGASVGACIVVPCCCCQNTICCSVLSSTTRRNGSISISIFYISLRVCVIFARMFNPVIHMHRKGVVLGFCSLNAPRRLAYPDESSKALGYLTVSKVLHDYPLNLRTSGLQ